MNRELEKHIKEQASSAPFFIVVDSDESNEPNPRYFKTLSIALEMLEKLSSQWKPYAEVRLLHASGSYTTLVEAPVDA